MNTDPRVEIMARALDAALAIEVRATSGNPKGYGPPFEAPWYIIDTSSANPEVNWPGGLIEEVDDATQVHLRLRDAKARAALAALDAARPAEIERLTQHVEELQAKINPDRDCACSYDEPGIMCAVHSPILVKAEAEIERLTRERAEFAELVSDFSAMHAPDGMEVIAKDRDKWFDRAEKAEARVKELREALQRAQRPEGETIAGVVLWIKEDADRLAAVRTALANTKDWS